VAVSLVTAADKSITAKNVAKPRVRQATILLNINSFCHKIAGFEGSFFACRVSASFIWPRASFSAFILNLIPPPPKQILFGNHYLTVAARRWCAKEFFE
jgi:hypothetical protein